MLIVEYANSGKQKRGNEMRAREKEAVNWSVLFGGN